MTFTRARLRFCSGVFLRVPKDFEIATSKSKKRILADGEPGAGSTSSKSKKEAIASKISEVESIVKKLQDKHGSQYSVEKFNAWAHLVHVGKHSSHDDLPDLPYFRGTRKRKLQSAREGPSGASSPTSKSSSSVITSPGKGLASEVSALSN